MKDMRFWSKNVMIGALMEVYEEFNSIKYIYTL